MGKLNNLLLVQIQKQQTLTKTTVPATFTTPNRGLGLKQFTVPDETPIRHSLPDPTAKTALGKATHGR